MVPKSGPKSDQKVGQKWHQKLSRMKPQSWSKKGSTFEKIALTGGCFLTSGLLKKRLLEDAFKKRLVKNGIAKNGPKLIPTWFKIAQIA